MMTAPKQLFHYTTQDGFLGILGSDSIWATKIHYLNDTSEFSVAIGLAKNTLDNNLPDKSKSEREKIKRLRESLDNISEVNICVASFSEKPDLLSQWRAYSGQYGGYSIGFSSEALRNIASKYDFRLIKCIYEKTEQHKIIRKSINEYLKSYLAKDYEWTQESAERNSPPEAVSEFFRILMTIAPSFKDIAFQEEFEWRLVNTKAIWIDHLEYRSGTSSIIPYISLPLGSKYDYLGEIVVGPSPHMELAVSATLMYVAKNGATNMCKFIKSKVPYRNW